MLAAIPIGICVVRVPPDGMPVFDYISPRAARVLGLTPAELDRDRHLAFGGATPADRNRLVAAMRRAAAGGSGFTWTGTMVVDGAERAVRIDAEPEPQSPRGDGVPRWFGIVEDITEAVAAARAVALREAALQEAEHVGRVGSWTLVPAGGNSWSDELFRIHGVDPADGVPPVARYASFLTDEDFARADAAINGVLERGVPYEIEYDIHRPDGSTRRILSRGAPIRDEAGDVRGVRGTIADITELADARDSARASASLQRSVFEAIADGIVVQDLEGRITAANPQARQILGLELDDITGLTSFDPRWQALDENGSPFPGDRHPAMVTLATGEPCRDVLMNLAHPDGRRVWIRVNSEVLRDDTGSTVGVVASFTDVTAQRALEERLRQAERLEVVGRLAGGVAHEFNNMLVGILGFGEVARDALPVDTQVRADVEAIIHEAGRAAQLVRQLLAFSQRQMLLPSVVDAGAVVMAMEPVLRERLGDRIGLTITSRPDLPPIRIDPAQMEQVITELVVNARLAMPDGGALAIAVLPEVEVAAAAGDAVEAGRPRIEPGVRLVVADTGTGMDAATLARAFEPFFTTRGLGMATGMGLSTVLGIVEQSGGRVGIHSAPGAGTTVLIDLPAARDDGGE